MSGALISVGADNDYVYNYSTALTVTNSTNSPVTDDAEILLIDATARTKSLQITGNSKANTILG